MYEASSVRESQKTPRSPAGRRLRVLVVGPVSEGGGLARVARMSAEGFDERRFSVAVCDTSRDLSKRCTRISRLVSHFRRLGRLIGALRSHQPQVVHLHTCSHGTFFRTVIDGLACIALRRHFVVHVHGGLFAEFLAGLHGTRRSLAYWFLRRANAVAVLSEGWRTGLTRVVSGVRIHVVPNAVALPVLRATDARRGGGVVCVGDLGEVKRPEDLLVAYAALPSVLRREFRLTLIGDGEPNRRSLLVNLADRLGVAEYVEFTGALPHEDALRRIARADLFVLPSRAEGMPMALLEAMAAGTPAVATRVGAVPEIARDGDDALLVDAEEPAALAKAMRTLLETPARRVEMAQSAMQRAQRDYSPDRFRSALSDLWSSVAQPEPMRRADLPRLATSYRSIL